MLEKKPNRVPLIVENVGQLPLAGSYTLELVISLSRMPLRTSVGNVFSYLSWMWIHNHVIWFWFVIYRPEWSNEVDRNDIIMKYLMLIENFQNTLNISMVPY